jgi:hypothetical protein
MRGSAIQFIYGGLQHALHQSPPAGRLISSHPTGSETLEFLALRHIRCAVHHKYLDKEFEFRLVESEAFEDEVLLISVPVSSSLESSDFVVDSFHGATRDRIVIPIENSRSVALQSVGHSLKDANTGCSRTSAPVIKEDGGRCPASLGPDLSEVFLEVVTDVR